MDFREIKQKAQALYARGKFRKSRELYEAAALREPNDAQLHLRLADCCRKVGDVQSAARFFERSAEILYKAGHAARASAALRLALELKPRDAGLLSFQSEISAYRTPPQTPVFKPALDAHLNSVMSKGANTFGHSARALSLEIPIVVDDSEDVDLSDEFLVDEIETTEEVVAPPISEPVVQASFVRLSDHRIAVRTGSSWTVFTSSTAIREEELDEVEFAERMQALASK